MKTYEFTSEGVARATYDAILQIATHPRPDVLRAIKVAREIEARQAEEPLAEGLRTETRSADACELPQAGARIHARAEHTQPTTQQQNNAAADAQKIHARAAHVLDQIIENAQIAHADHVPICQDTGSTWVRLEVGRSAAPNIPINILDGVNEAVASAYKAGKLRMSMLHDALFDRTNTKTNTPAFTEVALVPGNKIVLHVMLKGGGSDNASRVCMLPPSAGRAGIKEEIVKCVREKAANACPPLVIGVGVGATFDKVGALAKHALLRPVSVAALRASVECAQGVVNHAEDRAAFEAELLRAVNATGIGPGALGGSVTALAVHVETAPCHIAALPLAINVGCSAWRSASIELQVRSAGY